MDPPQIRSTLEGIGLDPEYFFPLPLAEVQPAGNIYGEPSLPNTGVLQHASLWHLSIAYEK